MRAAARIVAAATDGRGTRLVELRSDPPLLLRRTGPSRVHLVGGAAGPLGGDDLRLDIEVGAGAELEVRSVAASVALPGPGPSRLCVHVTVGAGGRLVWLPEPLIAAAGCHHLTASTVELAAGATLVWRDELVCGRHGEPPGDARLSAMASYDGRALYHHELAVGPSAPGWSGAAVLGGVGATGSVLRVDPEWTETGPPPAAVLGPSAAVMPLAGPAVLAMATGTDLREVRRALDPTCTGPWPIHDRERSLSFIDTNPS